MSEYPKGGCRMLDAELLPGVGKRSEKLVDCAAGRIRFISLNKAAGRTKFCRGPHLARGPDFGHACYNRKVSNNSILQ